MKKFDAAGAAQSFLTRHGMYYDRIDMAAELEKLLAVMEADFRENGRTGRMIPTYVGDYQAPATERTVTVIDIGGTNVRSAAMTIGPHGISRIGEVHSFLTPGVVRETDTAHFFREIVEGVRKDLVSDEVGICFSLATIPQRDRDAVMVAGGKQIRITDMLGRRVGESFAQAMTDLGIERKPRITVINDTVAAALGGRTPEQDCGSYIGFIYGTGINMCYREPTGEWINTEVATYAGFPAGDIDDAFDAGLLDPGGDRLEKMVSGGYQGGLMMCILDTAAKEGVISERIPAVLKAVSRDNDGEMLSSRDISEFCKDPHGRGRIAAACESGEDREIIAAICEAISERSVRICCVVLTAGLLRCGSARDPSCPVMITAEGSTYLKQKDFREKLEKCMAGFTRDRCGLHFVFRNVPDVILRGIGTACLSA